MAVVDSGADAAAQLLPLALSRPHEAARRARLLLQQHPSPLDASYARQAIGIVLRETGDAEHAVFQLRAARSLARRACAPERESDVLATLGVALAFAGRTTAARRALDAAVEGSRGLLNGRILLRRGGVLLTLGHFEEALADLGAAARALQAAGDQLWEARARTERAFTHLALGRIQPAAADLRRAAVLFEGTGQELECADTVAHRGILALRTGDLPGALACFDQAATRYDELGVPDPDLAIQRCTALLAAGLPLDARQETQAALTRLDQVGGRPTKRAELLLTAATCALAAGRPEEALDRAEQARALFGRQGRRWWRAHAELAAVQAAAARGPATASLLRRARRCAQALQALESPQLAEARLVIGRIAIALGEHDLADRSLAEAARERHRGPAQQRASAWLAEALRAEAAGDGARMLRACRRGLAVIDEQRRTLGSPELQARVTAHGAELAVLGQRQALRSGRAPTLLAWSERWRASALAVPVVRPPDDVEFEAELAALRDVTSRLADALASGLPSGPLRREQHRLERRVRARALRTPARPGGSTVAAPQPAAPGGPGRSADPRSVSRRVLAALEPDDRLVELVEVDGRLHVLVCGAGRVTQHRAGSAGQAHDEVEFARFTLTRVAYGMSHRDPGQLLQELVRAGALLQELLLGDAVDRFGAGDGRIVVVPPGRLHAVPWGLLPQLRDRVVAVAPSAASWLRAREVPETGDGRVVLVRGPGLASGGGEVTEVAARAAGGPDRSPVVLADGAAGVQAVLQAIDGADLVHIAAHGTFRADSPLFSALHLDDGPLTCYDLQRLHLAPRRLVLSSCDSGLAAPAGADELLGLANALVPLGTRAVVASVVPVEDEAAVGLMTGLHEALRAGRDLAEALRDGRRRAGQLPAAVAAAASFLCLGAG